MAVTRQSPPTWYWVVAIVLVLWFVMGLASFYAHLQGPDAMGGMASDYDRRLYASLPGWYNIVFAIATWGGLATGIALLLRRSFAVSLAVISLVAVVVMFGWMFLATDIIAVKGVWTTYFPALIFVLGAFSLWFARLARARGWIA